MLGQPNPILDEKERSLVDWAPEECFRLAVQRGAFVLDEASSYLQALSPRVLAVVHGIAAGERVSLPKGHGPSMTTPDCERALNVLNGFPQIVRLLNERTLTPDEAMEVAHAIDNILGRYLTGTKYAAP
jgi:hypothetical protein